MRLVKSLTNSSLSAGDTVSHVGPRARRDISWKSKRLSAVETFLMSLPPSWKNTCLTALCTVSVGPPPTAVEASNTARIRLSMALSLLLRGIPKGEAPVSHECPMGGRKEPQFADEAARVGRKC